MQHAIKFTLCKIPIDSNIDNDSNVAENFDNFNHNIWLLFWVFFFLGGGGQSGHCLPSRSFELLLVS